MRPSTSEEIHAVIRSNGGRITPALRALVDVLLADDRHRSADDLITEVDRRLSGVAPSTMYRLLQRLEELDVVEHVHSGRGPAIYHLRERSHAHLVCHHCGAVTDVPEAVFDALGESLAATYRFALEPRHAALLGRCADCAR